MENHIPCENCPHRTNPDAPFCCGIIPFPLKFLEEHKKFFKENGELKDNGDTAIILTADFLCVFFDRQTHKCAIYEERPEVCRNYGIIEDLPCPYFKRSGNRRSPASEKITIRKINAFVDKAEKNLEKDDLPVMPFDNILEDKKFLKKGKYDFTI
jgi:Fe-S-cluster containining protein